MRFLGMFMVAQFINSISMCRFEGQGAYSLMNCEYRNSLMGTESNNEVINVGPKTIFGGGNSTRIAKHCRVCDREHRRMRGHTDESTHECSSLNTPATTAVDRYIRLTFV